MHICFIFKKLLIIFQFYQFCRCFTIYYWPTKLSWFYNKKVSRESNYQNRQKYYKYAIITFFLAVSVSFIINCVIFITKTGFNNSLSKGENSLQELNRAFVTIQNFIDSISISVRKVGTDLADSTCSQALNYVGLQANFTTNTDAVASNVDTIGIITGQIPDFIIYVSYYYLKIVLSTML